MNILDEVLGPEDIAAETQAKNCSKIFVIIKKKRIESYLLPA